MLGQNSYAVNLSVLIFSNLKQITGDTQYGGFSGSGEVSRDRQCTAPVGRVSMPGGREKQVARGGVFFTGPH